MGARVDRAHSFFAFDCSMVRNATRRGFINYNGVLGGWIQFR